MTRRDARGNPVSTGSAPALAASEKALWRMMSFYGTPIADLDDAIAADPGMAAAAPDEGRLPARPHRARPARRRDRRARQRRRAREGRERARARPTRRTAPRRRRRLARRGRGLGRGPARHPRDALALQWAHLFDFYRGDAESLRQRVAEVLPAWPEDDPLHPYVLALHAFGLEESARYAEAEAVGRRALAGAARVPWAIHAVAHVMEMQARHEEGARWMGEWRRHWGADEAGTDAGGGAVAGIGIDVAADADSHRSRDAPPRSERNGFAGHLGWHEALFALEGLDFAGALRVYDAYLDSTRLEITLQRVDAASLLWRLRLLDADVGDRWQALLAGWRLDAAAAGRSVFNDAHATMALIGAGEMARAREWVALCRDEAERRGGWNREVSREIGAALMGGLLAFGAADAAAATTAIAPLRAGLARIGGSHAQRDVVELTLLAAAARGGDRSAGRALLAARGRARPATPLSEWWARALR
jgi:hypothetical protein